MSFQFLLSWMRSLSTLFDLKLGTKSATISSRHNRAHSLDAHEKAAHTAHVGTVMLSLGLRFRVIIVMLLWRFIFEKKIQVHFVGFTPTKRNLLPQSDSVYVGAYCSNSLGNVSNIPKSPCQAVIDLIFPLAPSHQSQLSSVRVNCCNKVLFMLPDICEIQLWDLRVIFNPLPHSTAHKCTHISTADSSNKHQHTNWQTLAHFCQLMGCCWSYWVW